MSRWQQHPARRDACHIAIDSIATAYVRPTVDLSVRLTVPACFITCMRKHGLGAT